MRTALPTMQSGLLSWQPSWEAITPRAWIVGRMCHRSALPLTRMLATETKGLCVSICLGSIFPTPQTTATRARSTPEANAAAPSGWIECATRKAKALRPLATVQRSAGVRSTDSAFRSAGLARLTRQRSQPGWAETRRRLGGAPAT
jgi:hypothetical protein